jgi:enoyl-CoA hydratase/carnithine racemase
MSNAAIQAEPWETLLVDHEANGLVNVCLNRPAHRNAINLQMCIDVAALFEQLSADESVSAVVLRGTGTAFCAGVDIKELAQHEDDWVLARRNRGLDAYLAIERCPVPVLAAVHGPAIGGGAEMAMACDFIFAAQDAVFQWPEALRGGVGATQRLPRAVGMPRAKELLFTGRGLSAVEAKELGIVNRVTGGDQLDAAVSSVISQMLAADPVALRGIKQAMNVGEGCARPAAVDIERDIIAAAMAAQRSGQGRGS